jgi:hypothetical protein
VQSGARRHGIVGIYGNGGNVESATYRIQRVMWGSNPTLSDSHTSSVTAPCAYLTERTIAGKPDRHGARPQAASRVGEAACPGGTAPSDSCLRKLIGSLGGHATVMLPMQH